MYKFNDFVQSKSGNAVAWQKSENQTEVRFSSRLSDDMRVRLRIMMDGDTQRLASMDTKPRDGRGYGYDIENE